MIPFIIAYLIVIGYNLLVKGPIIDLREFLYPLISDRGYVGSVELELPDVTHAWIGASALFLTPVCMAIFEVFFPKKDKQIKWFPFYHIFSHDITLFFIMSRKCSITRSYRRIVE